MDEYRIMDMWYLLMWYFLPICGWMLQFGASLYHFISLLWHFIKNEKKALSYNTSNMYYSTWHKSNRSSYNKLRNYHKITWIDLFAFTIKFFYFYFAIRPYMFRIVKRMTKFLILLKCSMSCVQIEVSHNLDLQGIRYWLLKYYCH